MQEHSFIQRLAAATYRAMQGKQKQELEAVAQRALAILVRKRLLAKFDAFMDALEDIRRAEEGIVAATVESRSELSPTQVTAIKEFLKRRTKKEVELALVHNKQLLGGFRIRFGDTVIDATVDAQVKQLASQLTI